MKLTKQRKVYVALGTAAVLALLGDRLFLDSETTGPRPAAAGVVSAAEPNLAAPSAADQLALLPDPANSVAGRLSRIESEHELTAGGGRDAFAPAGEWLRPTAADKSQPADKSGISRFTRDHKLEAVVPGLKRGCVIVDGATMFVGQKLNGFTLVQVRNRSAVFERDGTKVELHMDEQEMPR